MFCQLYQSGSHLSLRRASKHLKDLSQKQAFFVRLRLSEYGPWIMTHWAGVWCIAIVHLPFDDTDFNIPECSKSSVLRNPKAAKLF